MAPQFTGSGTSSPPSAELSGTELRKIRLRWGALLTEHDIQHLALGSRAANGVERRYKDAFRRRIFLFIDRALEQISQGILTPKDFNFQDLVTEQAISAMKAGLKRPKAVPARMARNPLPRIFQLWDKWRKTPSLRQEQNAKDVQKLFLHTVQSFWKKHSQDFRKGSVYDLEEAKAVLASRAKIVITRANMIVATETTVYFNQARKQLYDQADGVTHYLFVAIRDARTTKWCTDYHKGGRDGLVYLKGAKITDEEFPACHWNCRSEMLPLSPSNPVHRKLIDEARRARSNNSPAPLPRDWNGR